MRLIKEIVFTVCGMGCTTLGIILLIGNQAMWPIALVVIGIPVLMASIDDD